MPTFRIMLEPDDVAKLFSGSDVTVDVGQGEFIKHVSVGLMEGGRDVIPETIRESAIQIVGRMRSGYGIPVELDTYGDHVTVTAYGCVIYSSIGNMVNHEPIDKGLTFDDCMKATRNIAFSAANHMSAVAAFLDEPKPVESEGECDAGVDATGG